MGDAGRLDFPLLAADQIEVKVKKVTEKGAILLLYKTARVDMDMLDATVGAYNWECRYDEIKGNLFCSIGVFDETRKELVWKSDCGIQSRADNEGNEKKGEASDAFKRAGFRWGIGRELYSSPFIFATVPTTKSGTGYTLKGFPKFNVEHIAYDGNRRISELRIIDDNGVTVFTYPKRKASQPKAQAPEPQMAQTTITKTELITMEQQKAILSKVSRENVQKLLDKYQIARLDMMDKATADEVLRKLEARKK